MGPITEKGVHGEVSISLAAVWGPLWGLLWGHAFKTQGKGGQSGASESADFPGNEYIRATVGTLE